MESPPTPGPAAAGPSSVFGGGAAAPAEFLPDESSPLAELPAAAAGAEAERGGGPCLIKPA